MTAYVADSAASAPAPRGLPLSVQASSRHSTAVAVSDRPTPSASSGGEEWEEGESVVATEPPPASEEGPSLEELEAQMQGDVSGGMVSERAAPERRARRASTEDGDETVAAALPELDALVQRLPSEVRETLDELFRARFVAVKRVPARALKSRAGPSEGLAG